MMKILKISLVNDKNINNCHAENVGQIDQKVANVHKPLLFLSPFAA